MRYADDVLSFVPVETNLTSLLQELNGVEPAIPFTVEESNGQIPFLDTLILRSGSELKFTVYRKSISKNNIHCSLRRFVFTVTLISQRMARELTRALLGGGGGAKRHTVRFLA